MRNAHYKLEHPCHPNPSPSTPSEDISAAIKIVDLAADTLKRTIDHDSERLLFEQLLNDLVSLNLSNSDLTVVLNYSANSIAGAIIKKRYSSFEISEEYINSKQTSMKEFEIFGKDDSLINLVKSELSLIIKRQPQKIMYIGGGPLPYTAMFAHQLTGAHITVVDEDEGAISAGRKFINNLGLTTSFDFVLNPAEKLDVLDQDIVWLAAMVAPKQKAVTALSKTLRSNAVILDRQVVGEGEVLFGPSFDYSNNPHVKVTAWADNNVEVDVRSYALVKKPNL